MRKYRLVAKKGEGTFSEVLKAQNVKDGKYHAIKCMKNRFESIEQVNNLREIQALRRLSPHENIVTLEEVLYDQPTGRLALVFELMEANLYELIKGRKQYLNPHMVKLYMWQLIKSLDHMHNKGIFHRDVKPENILIECTTEIGKGLKLADFGSCRGIYSKQPYTEYISTRWYRAPECLLSEGHYGPEMDLWGAGCVMFEISALYPLFPGNDEADQISRIHKILGSPSPTVLQKLKDLKPKEIRFNFPQQKGVGIPQLIPHACSDSIDLIVKLLRYDASERITSREALRHPYFTDLRLKEESSNSKKENIGTNADCSEKTISIRQTDMSSNQSEDKINQIKGEEDAKNGMSDRRTSLPQLFADVEVSAVRLNSDISGKTGQISLHTDTIGPNKKKEIFARKDNETEKDAQKLPKIFKKDTEGTLQSRISKRNLKEKEKEEKGREIEEEVKQESSCTIPTVAASVESLDLCIPPPKDLGSEVEKVTKSSVVSHSADRKVLPKAGGALSTKLNALSVGAPHTRSRLSNVAAIKCNSRDSSETPTAGCTPIVESPGVSLPPMNGPRTSVGLPNPLGCQRLRSLSITDRFARGVRGKSIERSGGPKSGFQRTAVRLS